MGKKPKKPQKDAEMNMSAMIDIVFLLIIFFVVTAAMDKEIHDEKVNLANAPLGKILETPPKGAFFINVRENGDMTINGQIMNAAQVTQILKEFIAVRGEDFPLIIRGDAKVKHGYIMEAQKAITDAGCYRVRYNAQQM